MSALTGAQPSEEDPSGRLSDLNPMDIERIEVVKGLAAAQRYGPRAANGALVITTRRGSWAEPDHETDPSLPCYRVVY